mgnify:CR=1 FL=1
MRKLTAGLFCSVDGVVEDPFKWQFDSFDEELGAGMGEMMGRIDTALLGRVGYQQWADYWPNAESDADFAGFINPLVQQLKERHCRVHASARLKRWPKYRSAQEQLPKKTFHIYWISLLCIYFSLCRTSFGMMWSLACLRLPRSDVFWERICDVCGP